jgi:S-adenosylmethionine-diacylglycerol 3-amino-3-carboxypropyl transferase
MEAVFACLPLADNYFWRVYINGAYTPDCCPEYLKRDNFQRLKDGLADRVSVHTDTVQGFLDGHEGEISRFVLLDHMDWLSDQFFPALEAEWQAIVDRAAPGARVIWRSGGLRTDFVDRVQVSVDGQEREVGELLTYHRDLAAELHARCRVHTYGSFYIADLNGHPAD